MIKCNDKYMKNIIEKCVYKLSKLPVITKILQRSSDSMGSNFLVSASKIITFSLLYCDDKLS